MQRAAYGSSKTTQISKFGTLNLNVTAIMHQVHNKSKPYQTHAQFLEPKISKNIFFFFFFLILPKKSKKGKAELVVCSYTFYGFQLLFPKSHFNATTISKFSTPEKQHCTDSVPTCKYGDRNHNTQASSNRPRLIPDSPSLSLAFSQTVGEESDFPSKALRQTRRRICRL